MTDVNTLFAEAFTQASTFGPPVYANVLRFIGVMLVFIACSFALSHFLSTTAKTENEFMFALTTRMMKLLFGVVLIVLLFKP